jgi:hypothetical protein
MKININVRDFLEDYNAFGTLSAEARIAIEDLMECLEPSAEHEFDIDIHEQLDHHRPIAPISGTEDVHEERPQLCYRVEALEKFIHRTVYLVKAANPQEAEQRCRAGDEPYIDSEVVEGGDEWIETVSVSSDYMVFPPPENAEEKKP